MPDQSRIISGKLEQLSDLALFELRQEWRRLYRMQPPARLSRDLLTRGIAYRLQEQALGGVPRSVLRKLEQGRAPKVVGAGQSGSAPLTIKPGTRLVREWRGVTHSVLVQADHVEWQGERYRSLSEVARAITGARWSGPRFFGLTKRAKPAQRANGQISGGWLRRPGSDHDAAG